MTDINAILDAQRALSAAEAAKPAPAPAPATDINAILDAQRALSAAETADKPAPQHYDATEGMSGVDKFVAGYGGAVPQMALAAKQRLAELMTALPRPHTESGAALHDKIAGSLPGLYAEQAESKSLNADLNNTWQGVAGNMAGTAAPAVAASTLIPGAGPLAAKELIGSRLAALGLRMGVNAGAGGVQSLLTPTTSTEERNTNAGVTAALSAVLPALGSASRFAVGRMDPARQAMVDSLRSAGVKVSNARAYGGALNTAADKVTNVVPGLGHWLRSHIGESRGSVADAISHVAGGKGAPQTALEADALVAKVGNEYPGLYAGAKIDPTGPGQTAAQLLADNSAHDPHMIGKDAWTALRDSENKAYSGTALSGKEYRATVDFLNGLVGESGATGDIGRGLKQSWQTAAHKAMTPEQVVKEAEVNSRYALASRLREAVGDKGSNLDSISRKMVSSHAKLPDAATDLAKAGEEIFPDIHKPTQWQHYGLLPATAMAALYKPAAAAGAVGAVPVIKAALNAPGAPLQRAANNPTSRAAMAAILRAEIANQVENQNAP